MDVEDSALAIEAAAGDVGSLAVLLERHRARMYSVGVAILGPGEEVADAVQDSCLVAMSRIGTLHDPAAVGGWLTGIMRNVCRQRRRAPGAVAMDVAEAERLVQDGTDPSEVLDGHLLRDWVWGAVDTLSEPLRHVLVLRYFSRTSTYYAIAEVLGVPVGTVRSRLSEARRLLTRALERDAVTHDHRVISAERAGRFAAFIEEYNRGLGCSQLAWTFAREVSFHPVGSEPLHGREAIVRGLQDDIDLGCQLRVLDVIAGRDITVVEAQFLNPAKAPDHCSPLTTQVYLHRGDAIASIRAHYRAG